jgi:ferredoxin
MKRIVVDYELCEANAVCMKVAPEVFRVDEEDKLHVLVEQPPAELPPSATSRR